MKLVIEVLGYTIMLAFICFVSVEFVVADKQIANAQEYYSYVKDTIEINNYDINIVNKLVDEAKSKGYKLNYTDQSTEYDIAYCYWVELEYHIQIGLLGVVDRDIISGYVKSYF